MSVAQVIVICAVIVYGYHLSVCVVAESLHGGFRAAVAVRRGLNNTYQQASVVVIIGNGVSNGLSGADTVLIIVIGVRIYSS